MKPIRSFLQHELNCLHVFSRLCRVVGKRRAMEISKAWERCRLYRVIYA
jgi:hypothetical protein